MNYETKDSGEREVFGTGAQRDVEKDKGRFDLIPYTLLLRVAQLYERGAAKYDDHNWRKGLPVSRCYSSLLRHAAQASEVNTCRLLGHTPPDGIAAEDHLAAVVFNAACLMQYEADAAREPEELAPDPSDFFPPAQPWFKMDVTPEVKVTCPMCGDYQGVGPAATAKPGTNFCARCSIWFDADLTPAKMAVQTTTKPKMAA